MSSVGGGIGTITKQHMAKNDYGIFVLSCGPPRGCKGNEIGTEADKREERF